DAPGANGRRLGGALVVACAREGRAARDLRDWIQCCAARRPIPFPLGDYGGRPGSSWLRPRWARWIVRKEFRRTSGDRVLPVRRLFPWLAENCRKGWRQSRRRRSFPSLDRDIGCLGATAGLTRGENLRPLQACG